MAAKGKAKMIDIFVWQISTGQVLAHLNNFHRGAIKKLQFSPAGDKLLSIGEDEKNSVAIYDWASSRILCSSQSRSLQTKSSTPAGRTSQNL